MCMWQGEEWAIFAAMPRSTLSAFRQITFELHGVTNDGLACRKLRPGWRSCWRLGGVHNVSETVALLEALDRQFVLVSNHGNNWWGAHSIASHVVPDLTEVTYVNRGALPPDFACEPVTADAINVHAPSGKKSLTDKQRIALLTNLLQSNSQSMPGQEIGNARFLVG